MKILFLTIGDLDSISQHEIYPDLLREFLKHGHEVYAVCARERRSGLSTELVEENGAKLLKVRIGNITKTDMIEKGISTVLIEWQYKRAIKKYFSLVSFDLVLYPTPPITLCNVVNYVKKRDQAGTYLLLKDIFPQNAVDIGILSKKGVKGILYRYFRYKEKKLYEISDKIGCMSEANVRYVIRHNPEISRRHESAKKQTGKGIVEICPNTIEPIDMSLTDDKRRDIREKYHIPLDRTVFVYGGNLGKPQGIGFMLKCLHSQRNNKEAFFLIVGSGTEYGRIQRYMEEYQPNNIALHQWIPKEEYNRIIAACDVGMIFLDHRFTIPNFPSRLLGYMSAKLPVLACTDTATDIGKVITENEFGWWCESRDSRDFDDIVKQIVEGKIDEKMKINSFSTLKNQYDVEKISRIIIKN